MPTNGFPEGGLQLFTDLLFGEDVPGLGDLFVTFVEGTGRYMLIGFSSTGASWALTKPEATRVEVRVRVSLCFFMVSIFVGKLGITQCHNRQMHTTVQCGYRWGSLHKGVQDGAEPYGSSQGRCPRWPFNLQGGRQQRTLRCPRIHRWMAS